MTARGNSRPTGKAPPASPEASPPVRRGQALACTCVGVMVTSLPYVGLWAADHLVGLMGLLAALALLTATAWRSGSGAALRVCLIAVFVQLQVVCFGLIFWPGPLLVAVVLVWLASLRWKRLRPALQWLRPGAMGGSVLALMGITVLLSTAALVAWAHLTDPAVGSYLASLRDHPAALAIAGVFAFSLVNSLCEEGVYTGAFLHELRQLTATAPALVVQSAGFGMLHFQGFPSGAVGVVMATFYGLMLGLIRVRSRGMLAPYLTHVLADVTIGFVAIYLL